MTRGSSGHPASPEETLARSWIEEVWNLADLDALDTFHPATFMNDGQASTPGDAAAWHREMRRTYPDLRYAIDEVIVAGDRVVIRWTARGTHQGPLWDLIPATGRPVTWRGVHIVRVRDGRIDEVWAAANTASILQQLGVRPLPPAEDPPAGTR
jgi:steroid delta-isomerase-like uncharacterized protein